MTEDLQILTLAQLTRGQDWRLNLVHDRPEALLIWTTRGQGKLLLDGQRRGVGIHNAIFVPARHLFALDLGRQALAQVLAVGETSAVSLPQTPVHLRIRDGDAMSELSALLEAATREQGQARPFCHEAMTAHATLIALWLRRQMSRDDHVPDAPKAAARLSAAFCARVSAHFAAPMTMADHAEALQVTPTHLTRACRAATGRTAADLLTERVLYEARHLLSQTKVPAQDIARHLGFGSAAYFTRFMQHHTQATPTELRRREAQRPAA